MTISFSCTSCGKWYRVGEQLGGKRVKCKACGTAMAIPRPIDEVEEIGEIPIAEPQLPAAVIAAMNSPVIIEKEIAPPSVMDKLPPWVKKSLTVAAVARPKSLWAWVLSTTTLLLIIGFLSEDWANPIMKLLAGVGAAVLAVVCVWMVMIGLAVGSRGLVGFISGAPILLILSIIAKTMRHLSKEPTTTPHPEIPWTTYAMAFAGGIGLVAMLYGAVTNPKAFKLPMRFAWMGLVMVTVSWLPVAYHVLAFDPHNRRIPVARSSSPTPPKPRPPIASRPPVAPVTPASPVTPNLPTIRPPEPKPQLAAPVPAADVIQVKWGGSWWTATRVKTDGDWVQIRYDSDKTYEWVEPWRVRDVGSKDDDLPSVKGHRTSPDVTTPAPTDPPGPKPAKR